MRSSLALILSAFVAGIAAQNNYTFPAGFNLGLVPENTRSAWCQAQRNTCPQICGGAASPNECDPDTLNFSCTCINGTVPDVALYTNTIPFFVCQANYAQCINNHPNDLQGQEQCKANAQCGTLNATAIDDSASTTSAAAASTTTAPTSTGSATQTASTTSASVTAATSKAAAMAVRVAQDHSTGLFVAFLLAAFRFVL
ncbi:hypothetical protein VTN77DRAFT_1696 [Rasamsonia byssochlamydoides]|uniref:uncharacterized protein n=1 Tax=Rasamsonia byssochlamydoides TaxID=89139 RepID=UPI003743F976